MPLYLHIYAIDGENLAIILAISSIKKPYVWSSLGLVGFFFVKEYNLLYFSNQHAHDTVQNHSILLFLSTELYFSASRILYDF